MYNERIGEILKVKFVDISQTKSASEIIFSALRKAIIEGDITVGIPLRQVLSDDMDKAKSEHLAILNDDLNPASPTNYREVADNADLAAELLRDHILGAKESLLASFPTLPTD